MKKFLCVLISLVTVVTLFAGCSHSENTVNRLLFDTAVTLTADCERSVLMEAVSLCEGYENLLSRTKEGSDVYKINNSEGFVSVSEETALIIKTALKYCEQSEGLYDITITPVSSLWNFNEEILPEAEKISEAVKKVDYKKIQLEGNRVNANGTQIDLGSAAKGYIADKLREFFKNKGVKNAIINLGGNVYVLGDKYTRVGIQKPFESGTVGRVEMKNLSAVTSGTYQRCFTKDGAFYHHILDPKTGYPKNTDLDSVTVIGESSMLCDIMSTVCLLSGGEKAEELISAEGLSAVLIFKNGQIKTVGDIDFKRN
ncbi:MAG: FAD:protein FMN transferase [Ruminococcaceae bacterium]|nr:FAD:protein FMN transferase [Oscillospiraceae bacterium]